MSSLYDPPLPPEPRRECCGCGEATREECAWCGRPFCDRCSSDESCPHCFEEDDEAERNADAEWDGHDEAGRDEMRRGAA